MRERKDDQRRRDDRRRQHARDRSLRPAADSSAGTEMIAGARLRRLQHRDARRRDQALQRHLRDDAEHDHHDERTQIAAPEQHQRARAAAVRQHHAVAEQQAAEEHQRRGKRRLQIDRLADIDDAAAAEQLRGRDRDAERQRIGPDQAAVAIGPPAAQAAEQAEAAQQADRAIDEADQQSAHDDNIGHAQHWLFPGLRAADTAGTAQIRCKFRAAITLDAWARPRPADSRE